MTKRQLEKVRKNFESVDFSRWHILSYEEMLKVNGGSGTEDDSDEEEDAPEEEEVHIDVSDAESAAIEEIEDDATAEDGQGGHEVENSHSAVAGAEPGDTITREDGTEITLTDADIEYEQNYCNEHGIDWGKDDELPQENPEANGGDAPEVLPEAETPSTSSASDEELAGDASESSGSRRDDTVVTGDSVKQDVEKETSFAENKQEGLEGEAKQNGTGSGKQPDDSGKTSGSVKGNGTDSASNKSVADTSNRVKEDELAVKKNSELNTPKETGVLGYFVDLVNKVGSQIGIAKDVSEKVAKTDLNEAPLLNDFSKTMSKLGGAVAFVDFANTAYKNDKSYREGEQSYLQSLYNTTTHCVIVGAVSAAAVAVTVTTLPEIACVTVAGAIAVEAGEFISDKIEEKIWGEIK